MNNNNSNPTLALVFFIVLILIFGIWQFAREIGADFQPTATALGCSVLILASVIGSVLILHTPALLTLSCGSLFFWPSWWRVLDSIAYGGVAENDFFLTFQPRPLYIEWYFKWGIEAVILGFTIWAFLKVRSGYY